MAPASQPGRGKIAPLNSAPVSRRPLRRVDAFGAGLVGLRSWLAPAGTFILALAVYLATAPSGLTWAHDSADGGDLIAAAMVAGVPHPTGYPTFTLLARLVTLVPFGSPAWRTTVLSAVSGALAAALVAAMVAIGPESAQSTAWRRATPDPRMLDGRHGALLGVRPSRESRLRPETTTSSVPSRFWLAGVLIPLSAGLMLAFAPMLWGQSTVTEVYALHAAFTAAILWGLLRWHRSCQLRWVTLSGLLLGLSLGNHLTTLWLLPIVLTFLFVGCDAHLPNSTRTRSDPVKLAPGRETSLGHEESTGWSRYTPVILGLTTVVGLSVYAYLPLAASGKPAVNWGDPSTLQGFWWIVSGQLYRSFVFAVPLPDVAARLQAWAGLLWRDFQPWGLVLALLGMTWLARRRLSLVVAALLTLTLGLAWAVTYDTTDSYLALLPGWVIVAVAAGVGLRSIVRNHLLGGKVDRVRQPLAVVIAGLLIVFPVARHWQDLDKSGDRQAEWFLSHVLDSVAPDALVVTAGDRATFGLWYARYGLERRPDIIPVSRDLWGLGSYRATIKETHPELPLAEPAADFSAFLRQVAQDRPIYLAQATGGASSPATLSGPESPAVDRQAIFEPVPYAGVEVASDWGLWEVRFTNSGD